MSDSLYPPHYEGEPHPFCGQIHPIGSPCPDNEAVRSRYLNQSATASHMSDTDSRKDGRAPLTKDGQHVLADVPNRKTRRKIGKTRGYFKEQNRGIFHKNSEHYGVRQPKRKGEF